MHYWRGFLFLFELCGNTGGLGFMTDRVQAKQELEFCIAELSKYQNLSRSGLTLNEMRTIDGIMIKLKKRIKNLKLGLYD